MLLWWSQLPFKLTRLCAVSIRAQALSRSREGKVKVKAPLTRLEWSVSTCRMSIISSRRLTREQRAWMMALQALFKKRPTPDTRAPCKKTKLKQRSSLKITSFCNKANSLQTHSLLLSLKFEARKQSWTVGPFAAPATCLQDPNSNDLNNTRLACPTKRSSRSRKDK